jgi:hypothetical protein
MAQNAFPNRIEGSTLQRWVVRAFAVGLAVGIVAGMAALLN